MRLSDIQVCTQDATVKCCIRKVYHDVASVDFDI